VTNHMNLYYINTKQRSYSRLVLLHGLVAVLSTSRWRCAMHLLLASSLMREGPRRVYAN
jgi:hypothetical protein